MSIERELQRNYQEVFYPPVSDLEPEVQVAAGPTETVSDTGPAFTMPGMGKRSQKSEVGQNLPVLAADVAAGAGKGLISGLAGFAGDIEALYQGVKGIVNRGGDETALQGFLRGMAEKTIAPTSDEVSKWLDANVGPVVPANSKVGAELQKARQTAAGAGEFAGQLVADPAIAVKGGKAVVKGAKALAPKAAEMVINATEKTGVPVTGLGIIEKTTAKTSEWIDKDSFTAYMKQPKQLQGFRKSGPNKGFDEENYKHVEFVEVKFEDGTTHLDAIRGLNKTHAISRAFGNWDPVAVRPVPRAEVMKKDPDLVKEVDFVMNRKSGKMATSQQEPQ